MNVVSSCSGHGTLVVQLNSTSKCICDEGWDDIGDFNPVEGLDCSIHRQSVLALAYVSLILGLMALIVFGMNLIEKWQERGIFDIKMRFALSFFIQTFTCSICK
jgi:hypothetical protein